MKNLRKVWIILVLAAAVTATVALKARDSAQSVQPTVTEQENPEQPAPPPAATPAETPNEAAAEEVSVALPRLLDLGADKCVPCKMMAPILEELEKEYAGKIDVEFVDVWKNPAAARKYGVKMIPTQIFFDASGKERFRHTGFLGKDAILAKWKELGML